MWQLHVLGYQGMEIIERMMKIMHGGNDLTYMPVEKMYLLNIPHTLIPL